MAVEISDDSSVRTQILRHPKVVIKYYAEWCGNCRLFSPKFKRLSDEERFSGITFLTINSEYNPESRKLAGVHTLPFFATFKNGQLVKTISTSNEDVLIEMLNEL